MILFDTMQLLSVLLAAVAGILRSGISSSQRAEHRWRHRRISRRVDCASTEHLGPKLTTWTTDDVPYQGLPVASSYISV